MNMTNLFWVVLYTHAVRTGLSWTFDFLAPKGQTKTCKTVFVKQSWCNYRIENTMIPKKPATKEWQKLWKKQPNNVEEVEEMHMEQQRPGDTYKILTTEANQQVREKLWQVIHLYRNSGIIWCVRQYILQIIICICFVQICTCVCVCFSAWC